MPNDVFEPVIFYYYAMSQEKKNYTPEKIINITPKKKKSLSVKKIQNSVELQQRID